MIWFDRFAQQVRGPVLVAGSRHYAGRPLPSARYPELKVVGVDMQAGDGVDVVADLEDPQPDMIGFGHVDCCSVLEHSRRPWLMAQTLLDCLQPGGTLLVSAPFVWRVHAYPSDYFRFTVEGIRSLFPGIEWDALELVISHGGDRVVRKVPALLDGEDIPHLARCEVYGFGRKL